VASIMTSLMLATTDLQIGSSTIANADWKLLQIVRMELTGMMGNNNNKPTASTADFITVTVIPYTGKSTIPSGQLAK
jgi:hypothetical protein